MCGIVGYFETNGVSREPLGQILLQMLEALGSRGPDSAGAAVFNRPEEGRLLARVKLSEARPVDEQVQQVTRALSSSAAVEAAEAHGGLLRLVLKTGARPETLTTLIEESAAGVEVMSLGHHMEIVKHVGTPAELEREYHLSSLTGRHGIGHTRLSTESRVDVSHSQPFWAHGHLDVATVHNGHITNYHRMRKSYEARGAKFYTDNDSELLGVYLADHLRQGNNLRKILERSLQDLDGSYCYLVATAHELAYVKDPFSLKPLVVGEGKGFVAIATEEVALRKVFPDLVQAREPEARSVGVWSHNSND